jgi:uncharacterized protein YhaN
MKLLELSIDGFGVHRRLRLAPLDPSLNVIVGPNESGKSTLCEFVRALFFGFDTTRRSRPGGGRHEPLRGGRHGGTAVLESETGERLVLSLRAGARRGGERVLTREDGMIQPPEALDALLGPITREFFENVHAFGLDELSDLRALSAPDMDDYLFGATSRTDPRRLTQARAELDARTRAILSPRSGRIVRAIVELQGIRDDLRGARDDVAVLPALQDDRDRCRTRIAECTEALERARRARARLERLAAAVPAWDRIEVLKGETARLSFAASLAPDASTEHRDLLDRWARAKELARIADHERTNAEGRASAARGALLDAERAVRRARRPGLAAILVLASALGLVLLVPGALPRVVVLGAAMGIATALLLRRLGVVRARREAAETRWAECARDLVIRRDEGTERARDETRALEALAAFHARSGATDVASFEALVRAKSTFDGTVRELALAERQLDVMLEALGEAGSESAREEISGAGERLERLQGEMVSLRAEIDAARERAGALDGRIDLFRASDRIPRLRMEEERLLAEVHELADAWSEARLAKLLLDEASRRYQEHHQPSVIRTASAMFEEMTSGEFRRVLRPSDLAGARLPLVCERHDGEQLGPEALSRGTREQLYLALRFAALAESVTGRPILPIVMDDVLVNCDDERVVRALRVVTRLTRTHQVLYLTCHRRMVDLVREASPAAGVFDLVHVTCV